MPRIPDIPARSTAGGLRAEAPGSVQGAVDERIVEDQFCALVGDLCLPPELHLAPQRFKVPLNPVYADGKRVDQVEALGVFGQHRREHAMNNMAKESLISQLRLPESGFGEWGFWRSDA